MASLFGKLSMGCDPEILVSYSINIPWGAKASGITGTKENPELVKYGAMQIDGMALEYNIIPAYNLNDWLLFNSSVFSNIVNRAEEKGLKVSTLPVLDYDYYIKVKASDEEKLLGCSPDYNADTLKENAIPNNKTTVRTAGGHIHIGFENWPSLIKNDAEHLMCQYVINICDLLLGTYSVIHDENIGIELGKNIGFKRKDLYGKAGAYRNKSYGVEYRTMSNFWVFKEEHKVYIYNMISRVFNDDKLISKVSKYSEDNRTSIIQAINNNNIPVAKLLLKEVLDIITEHVG